MLMAAPPVLVILVFVGLTMVSSLLYTFGYTGGVNSTIAEIAQHQYTGAPTLGAYHDVLTDSEFLGSLRATVGVTVAATAGILVLAWVIALWLRARESRFARAITGLSVVPLFIPSVIGSYAILEFYAPNGFIRTIAYHLGWGSAPVLAYTLPGVVVGSMWAGLPFAVLMVTSGLSSVPVALIDAARDVGAGPVRRFFSVILPMTYVPTIIAATFTAIGVLGSFTLPYIVGPTAPNLLGVLMSNTYTAFNMPQQAEVMAVVIFVLAIVAGVPYVWANFVAARRSS